MRRSIWMLGLITLLALTGCEEKKEEIPIAVNSSSHLEDEEPEDHLEELPGEEIPEYKVELPEKLSSFTIAVWGENYSLPVSYEKFAEMGWVYDGDASAMVGAESYVENEKFEQEGNVLYVDLMNWNPQGSPVSGCYVAGIHIDSFNAEGQGIYVNLPGDIVFQKSTEQEVTAVYGSAIDRYEERDKIVLTYEFGINRSVKLGFDEETKVLREIDIQNFRNPEGEEELKNVSDTPIPEVESYRVPKAAGMLFQEFVVQYDSAWYRLPAPVSSFMENGWEVNKEESDEAVKDGRYGYVTLEKGDQKLYAVVQNYGAEATVVQNCFVTTLYGDWDTTKVPITIAGGVTLGMNEEIFLTLAGEQKYEKSRDEESGNDIYTFYVREDHLDYTQVTVDGDLHLIRQIKVVHNQEQQGSQSAPDQQSTE